MNPLRRWQTTPENRDRHRLQAKTAFPKNLSNAHLPCLVNRDLLNKSSFAGSSRIRMGARKFASTSSTSDCVALLEPFERAGTPRHVDGRLTWREIRMKTTMKALFVAGGTVIAALGTGAATTPAQAQGKTITLC